MLAPLCTMALWNRPLALGMAEQRADLSAAARLAEDRDVARIAAEARGVVAHPFERGDEIEHADIARLREALAADGRQIEMAEDVEAVIDRDDHDVVAPARLVPS